MKFKFARTCGSALAVFYSLALHLAAQDTNPPTVLGRNPVAGSTVGSLAQVTVTFSEPVMGVDAFNLTLNGAIGTNVTGSGAVYTWRFPPVPAGTIHVAWHGDQGIKDLATNRFDEANTNNQWDYTLVDTVAPGVVQLDPAPGVTVGSLALVSVTFSEPVLGVNAADLFINGQPAASVSGSGAGPYLFGFNSPPAGPVQLAWAVAHGIRDTAPVPNNFAGGSWSYSLQPGVPVGNIIINEFLASNLATNGLRDEEGTLQDWIEIYNRGATNMNLYGWGLTDNPDQPDQWIFPNVNLSPGQYLIVFASGKNRSPTNGASLHANFQLPSAGAYLGLFNADFPREVATQFSPKYPEQRADISYGLISNSFAYLGVPTPGAANAGAIVFAGITADPKGSVNSGFFNQPFSVSLTTTTPGAAIRYTLDGSEPTPTGGALYTGPLAVAGSATKAVVALRAIAFVSGLLSSHVATYSYIFPDYVLLQPTNPPGFPSQWITYSNTGSTVVTINADYEMDPQVLTNAAYSTVARQALTNLPTLSLVIKTEDLFSQTNGIYANPNPPLLERSAWERPVSAELIMPDGSAGFKIDAGLRVQGGSSRDATRTPKHSLRLFFKGAYGSSTLDYPFFPDSPATKFHTLVIDAGLNLNWHNIPDSLAYKGQMVRDQFVADLCNGMGTLAPHGRFIHLYLNGLYWGMYYVHERPDANFAESYFGGDKSQYDSLRNNDGFEVLEGDAVAWNAMMALANGGLSSNTQYEQIQQYLDVDSLIDYLIANFYAGNTDWAFHNWYTLRKRDANGRFRFQSWDAEITFKDVNESSVIGKNEANSPTQLHAALKNNAEYKLKFADHVHRLFFNGGVFYVDTNNPAVDPTNPQRNHPGAFYMKRIGETDPAVVLESARWGDVQAARVNNPYTRNVEWTNELNSLRNAFFPKRSSNLLNQFRTQLLYPNPSFPGGVLPPEFSQHGGNVPLGFNLAIGGTTNTIYYTTGGADPRVYGTAAVSPSAFTYAGVPLILNTSVLVKARARNPVSLAWSPLTEATFNVSSLISPLRITEIMYNPSPGGSAGNAYEFIELQNIGPAPLDVSSFYLEGVTFVFPPFTTLAPGAAVVLASSANPADFAARYPGVTVFGYYSGALDNGGQRLAVRDAAGRTLVSVDYNDANGWPTTPDGTGPSLEIINVSGDPDDPANWRASTFSNGTPGTISPPPTPGAVVLNEVMADNVNAVANGNTYPDWVELYNSSVSPVSLSNWSLSDDGNSRKFVIPSGTNIAAGGYLVIWCDGPTNTPGMHTGFALSRTGETLSFYDAATNRVDALTFGLQLTNRTVGRVGGLWQLTTPTPNAANSAAAVAAATNLVINEWLASSAPAQPDWLELYNRSATLPVALRGCYLATSNNLFQITSLSFLPPLGYAQLFADEAVGPDHLDFNLPASGGAIILYDPAAVQIDSVTYAAQIQGQSEGRLPDGSATIVSFPGSASPGAMNYLVTNSGPQLNEVLARNASAVLDSAGRYADWFELYNPNPTNVNLAGMSLSVDEVQPGQWVIPTGTIITANGYLMIWCDGNRPASSALETNLNTGHSLNNENGGVYLFNAAGQIQDWVEYGFQITDKAIGKVASAWQLLASPTPKAANAAAATLGAVTNLCFNEWMANPLSGDDWFELYNRGTNPVNLAGLYLTDDPSLSGLTKFPIAPLSFIDGRDWVLWQADDQTSKGRDHVNFSLDGSGESIRLYNTNLTTIDAVDFVTQEAGVSEGRLPDGATNIVRFPTTPTPDASNFLPLTNIVINEVLAHTDPPVEDAIEFFNPTASAVNISGWYLSNKQSDPKRYLITNTIVPAGGFRVLYEYQFGTTNPQAITPFTFNSAHGDSAYLSEAVGGNLTGYRIGQSFDAAANGISFGRYQTSVGVDFTSMSNTTFGVDSPANVAAFRSGNGKTNSNPLISPIVINEVMYHPVNGNATEDATEEFIELYNRSNNVTPLYDPAHLTNRWRLDNAVRFDFPSNATVAAGGYVLIVAFDPTTNAAALANFRAKYGTNGTLFGPYSGKLDNNGESVELWRPDNPQTAPHPDVGFVPYILMDRVQYGDSAPWPTAADGGGASLQRIVPANYGNDPVNWYAAAPTVGRTNSQSGTTPPLITTQPTDTTVSIGGTAAFNVVATGTGPLAYQWQFNAVNLLGATSNSLTILNAQTNNAGSYLVRVTNVAGTVFSQPVTLTVLVPPAITGQPASQSVSVGANVTFTVTANGSAPLAYQWFSGGAPRPNATNASLTLYGVQVVDSGSYYVVVTNAAGPATSQVATLTVSGVDTDGDGIPDAWETAHGLNPNNPNDAALDSDGDGLSNLQEYLAGTDPQDPLSYLKIDSLNRAGVNQFVLGFVAVAGKSYTVLYRDSLLTGSWSTLADVAPDATTRTIQITNQVPAGLTNRFYRLVTPIQPYAFRIENLHPGGTDQLLLSFQAAAGKSYSVLYRDSLNTGSWLKSLDIPADPIARTVEVTNSGSIHLSNRFYRLVTPSQL